MQDAIEKQSKLAVVGSKVPARLDRLPWGRFHTLVIVALGITWILDGLEVTLAGSVAGALKASPVLQFSDSEIGLTSSFYLAGAVTGGLFFGWMADRFGRRLLFFVTLGLYIAATAATAFSWDFASFCLFRFLTGAGIGGEYSSINSTIQEMIPARFRGWTDLALGGTFWIGAALGAGSSILLLDPANINPEIGWRFGFLIGAALSLVILLLRSFIPESPRWLLVRGREEQAESVVDRIEESLHRGGASFEDHPELQRMRLHPRTHTPFSEVFHTIFVTYRTRALVGLTLMASQAFFYNAIFFTYALALTKFYNIRSQDVGWYIMPFALANVLGPLLIGRFFDTFGRRPMITLTYAISGILLAATGWLFANNLLNATQQTIAWSVIFFFASPAAGSAYLTVSEAFPVEIRSLAIAVFCSLGTAIGGAGAPYLLGALIETGSRDSVFSGYLLGSGLMLFGAFVEAIWGIAAERKPLEAVASPLSSAS